MADKYDNALAKCDAQGYSSLNSEERYLLKQLLKEHSKRGNLAREIVGTQ